MKKSNLKNRVIKTVALLSLVAPTALGSFATVANADITVVTPEHDGSTWWQGGKPGDNTTDVVDHTGNAGNTNNTGSNNNTTNNTDNTNKPSSNTGATDTTKTNENNSTTGNIVKDPNTTVKPGTDQVLNPTSTVNNSTENQTTTFGNTATGSTADLNKTTQLPQTDTDSEGLLATIIKAIQNFFN